MAVIRRDGGGFVNFMPSNIRFIDQPASDNRLIETIQIAALNGSARNNVQLFGR
jgi:hypothetical protein